ncbi:MAG TPA: replicative DNA helicase [Calditerricola sp.]
MTAEPLPRDDAAEKAVLGAILVDRDAIADVADLLHPGDFGDPAHRCIYEAVMTLWSHGEEVDVLSVKAELERRKQLQRVGGLAYLTALAESVPTAAHARQYAEQVAHKAKLRAVVRAAQQAILAARDGDLEKALAAAGRILDAGVDRDDDGEDLWITAFKTLEAMYQRRMSGDDQGIVPTGFSDLDERLDGGLWPGEMTIVAARTGTGKTAFLLQVSHHVAQQGKPVLFFTLEQSRSQLSMRAMAAHLKRDASLLRRGWLREEEWQGLMTEAARRGDIPLHVVEGYRDYTVEKMLARARQMQRSRGLALVVVDYLQIVSEPRMIGQSREERVAEISRKLKAMALDLRVPVLCAAQLNRRADDRDRPSLSDIRESGAIEQDADVVLFLWRPDRQAKERVKLTIAKQRNGTTGEIDLYFRPHLVKFEQVDTRHAGGA